MFTYIYLCACICTLEKLYPSDFEGSEITPGIVVAPVARGVSVVPPYRWYNQEFCKVPTGRYRSSDGIARQASSTAARSTDFPAQIVVLTDDADDCVHTSFQRRTM